MNTACPDRFLREAVFVLFLIGAVRPCSAEEPTQAAAKDTDSNFQYRTVQTKEGLSFRVPEDMPIENRGGIQAPIPFDEYMYGKFKKIDERLANIEAKIGSIENILTAKKGEEAKAQAPKPKGILSTE